MDFEIDGGKWTEVSRLVVGRAKNSPKPITSAFQPHDYS